MYDLIRPYVMIVKLWGLIAVLVTVGGYIALLHYRIAERDETIRFQQATVRTCDLDRTRLRTMNQIHVENLNKLDNYYRERGCLELRDGALTDDEMLLR